MIPLRSNESLFTIPGPVGGLEAILTPAESGSHPNNHIAIICHPHPLFGGTFQNKVVTTLAQAFNEVGTPAIRFNFRGVGNSAGVYDHALGEQDDLLAVIKWVLDNYSSPIIDLAGFSFGSAVSIAVANQFPDLLNRLISIAPPINLFPPKQAPCIQIPWLIVQGDADDVVDPSAVFAWIDTLNPKPKMVKFNGVGHFFHGKLSELKQVVLQELSC